MIPVSSQTEVKLLVAPCSYNAAKYAVEHWHYSGCMPAGKTVKFGVWEDDKYIGAVVFSRGASPRIGSQYGLLQTEVSELTRVALNNHYSPTSQVVSISIKLVKQVSIGIRLIVSFADPSEGHYGGIYQAMNWLYVGKTENEREVIVLGKSYHRRSAHSKFGSYAIEYLQKHFDPDAQYGRGVHKYKYLYPLDKAMRRQIAPLAQPYPKKIIDASD